MSTRSDTDARNRNVRLWMTGTSVSLFGDAALWLAMGIWVKDLTGSNGAAGLAFLAYLLPRLFTPLTGYVVDRMRKRPLIMWLDFALGAWVLLALAVHDRGDVWLIYLILFGVGLGSGLHNAGGSALLTQLVDPADLGRVNATLRTMQEVGMLIAPAVGTGLYIASGPYAVVLLEAGAFFACALCVFAVRLREAPPAPPDGRLVAELLAGIKHIGRTVALRDMVLAMACALLAFGLIETIIYAIADQGLHRPASFVGVLTFVKGAGSVLGGLMAMRIARKLSPGAEGLFTAAGLSLMAAGAGVLILPGVVAAVAGVLIIGLGIPPAVVGLYTLVQRSSPAQLQGRVAAAASTMVTTPQVISVAAGAALISLADYRLLLGVILGGIAAAALFLGLRARARLAVAQATPNPATEGA